MTKARQEQAPTEESTTSPALPADFESMTLADLIVYFSRLVSADDRWIDVAHTEGEWAIAQAGVKRHTPTGWAPGWAPDRTFSGREWAAHCGSVNEFNIQLGTARNRRDPTGFRRVLVEYLGFMSNAFEKWATDREKSRCAHGKIGVCLDCENDRSPPGAPFAARWDDPRHP